MNDHQLQRFMKYVVPVTESGCWIWMGSINPKGYGQFNFNSPGSQSRAHRIAFEHFKQIIPLGLQLDHLCRVRCCVNPNHLEIVTNQENVLSGHGVTAKNAQKTHCPRGHEYTTANICKSLSGHRRCRMCDRARKRDKQYLFKRRIWEKRTVTPLVPANNLVTVGP